MPFCGSQPIWISVHYQSTIPATRVAEPEAAGWIGLGRGM